MQNDDQKQKLHFTKKAAWLGLISYIVLILVIIIIL